MMQKAHYLSVLKIEAIKSEWLLDCVMEFPGLPMVLVRSFLFSVSGYA